MTRRFPQVVRACSAAALLTVAFATPAMAEEAPAPIVADTITAAAVAAGVEPATAPAVVADDAAGVRTTVPGSTTGLLLPGADVSARSADATIVDGVGDSQAAVQEVGEGKKRVSIMINSATDPQRYDVKFVGAGGLELGDDGTVLVLDKDGTLDSAVEPAWARDAAGVAVPTHFEVNGTTLTQVVEHRSGNYEYGVTADPLWIGGWVLYVVGSRCGVGAGGAALLYRLSTQRRSMSGYFTHAAVGCVTGGLGIRRWW